MARFIDLTGRRFGKLTVVQLVPAAPHNRWLCACDYGTVKVIVGQSLRRGRATSCGCWRREILARLKTKHGRNRGATGDLIWRRKIKERDNHTCQKCGRANLSGKEEHAHHKFPVRLFPEKRYDLDNGETLCNICHPKETKKEMMIYG